MSRSTLKNIMKLIDEANEELPVEASFLLDLQRSMVMSAEKNARHGSNYYKPSSMRCIRSMYYTRKGYEKRGETTYTSIGITNSGSDIHERVQSYVTSMKENGMDCEYIDVAEFVKNRNLEDIEIVGKCGMETKLFHKKLQMSFLCDGIIRYKNKYYILEIKTETSYKFQTRKGVDPKHYEQGTAYSVALGLDDVLFLYINRDILEMKTFMFKPTDDMKQDLVGKIDNCENYLSRDEVPPKPEEASPKFCTYCDYKERCKSDN